MNIDIRNPNFEITKAVEFVQEKHNITTVSKSITFICRNYLKQREEISQLTQKDYQQRKRIKELENQLQCVKDFKKMLEAL